MTERLSGLRIGLVGPVPPPDGGMANQTRQLASLLASEGALVHHVLTNAPYRPSWVGRFRGVRAVFRLAAYSVSLWRAARRSEVFHVMANSGWNWHLFAVPAIVVGRVLGVPVVVNYRGGGAVEFLARSARWVRPAMAHCAALIVPSGFLVDVFARFGMAAGVVPNIVDLDRFQRRPPRADDGAHVIVTRHLEALYDNATALRAFAQLRHSHPQARLTIAGVGPELDNLCALASGLGIADAVCFSGALDRDAMAALYAGADLSLNPSLADNMPNSVLEAMASGVPVVSTRVGGVPYMLDDGRTGLLVPPGDADAMVVAMRRLLDEPGLWQALTQAAADAVLAYTWAQVRKRLAATYAAAIDRQPNMHERSATP